MLSDGPVLANNWLPGWCVTAFIDQVKNNNRETAYPLVISAHAQAHNIEITARTWDLFYLVITTEIHNHVSQNNTSYSL